MPLLNDGKAVSRLLCMPLFDRLRLKHVWRYMSGAKEPQVALVLLLFSLFAIVRHLDVRGEDLSSSYIGCRILAAGDSGRLYSHDPSLFNVVADPLWAETAIRSGFSPHGQLHPYVQTPLWAFALGPLCTHASFPVFNRIFLVITILCFSATIWLTARYWTPRLFHPGWIALICTGLYISAPFRYALFLTQTHILFIFLTILALIYAPRRHPVFAGILLSVAAAVKITPAFFFLYWLLTRQKKAALSFAVSSLALAALTLLTAGPTLTMAYLQELSSVSNVLLIAFNNQSLAAFWMAHEFPATELFYWHIFPLPAIVKVVSLLLSITCTIVGGLIDRETALSQPPPPPYGAVLAMVGATMFTPIAWSHYYIVLLVPIMLMLDMNLQRRSPGLLALAIGTFVLNLYPLAFDATLQHVETFSVIRSHFFAGLLSLAGLILLSRPAGRHARTRSSASGRLYSRRPRPESMHTASSHQ